MPHSIPIYTVDAFSDTPFRGNTCAVCIFPAWPEDGLLQKIAAQNLFAETAFIMEGPNGPELRWFTVSQEVTFCGYGTLSAAYVYLDHLHPGAESVLFRTRQYGDLRVEREGGLFKMEAPVKRPLKDIFDDSVMAALGGPRPDAMITSERGDLLIVYPSEEEVRAVTPDFARLMTHDYYGYVLTAPGRTADYAYRYFSPRMPGVWEDPVNGSSHSVLAPYWAERLDKQALHAQAVSQRGGDIFCLYRGGEHVSIGGHVSLYQKGEIFLPS